MPTFAWPHRTTLPVMFRDLDAMGHVNNAVSLAWLEQARNTGYLEMLGRTDPLESGRGLDFVVARAEVDYVAPIHFGDTVAITTWPVHVGRSSFHLAYDCRRQDGAQLLRARTVQVTYDWQARKSKPLPDEVAHALRAGLDAGTPLDASKLTATHGVAGGRGRASEGDSPTTTGAPAGAPLMMELRFRRLDPADADIALPSHATEGAAGLDLRAAVKEPLTLRPGERAAVPTGLAVEVPAGYELQVRPRSGLALEHGITCMNSPGTIDSDYRGEIKVILGNLGDKPHAIARGDRIAQLVLAPVTRARVVLADSLPPTARGDGGFGSTGR